MRASRLDPETALVTLQAIGMLQPVTKLISDGVATGKHGIEIAAQVVQAMQAAEHGCPAEVIRDATALQGRLCLATDAIRSKHPLPLPALREKWRLRWQFLRWIGPSFGT